MPPSSDDKPTPLPTEPKSSPQTPPPPPSKPTTSPPPPTLLLLPYLIGIIWIFLHPIISITTGELKCRGSFIDESAFMLDYFTTSSYDDIRISSSFEVTNDNTLDQSDNSLCNFLSLPNDILTSDICTSHQYTKKNMTFDVAHITSEKSITTPRDAIALILPPWQSSDFHAGIVELMKRLTSSSPWLSKSVLIVAGRQQESLEDVVEGFIRSYVGRPPGHDDDDDEVDFENWHDPHQGGYLIRHAIVYNVTLSNTSSPPRRHRQSSPITILPQGKWGILPNLDYVFGIIKSFQRYDDVRIHLHPFVSIVEGCEQWVMQVGLGEMVGRGYVQDLMGMVAFMKVLALGPYPPHSSFLQRGIDSVTLYTTQPSTAHLLRSTEHFIRGLSNLHERLHHSVQQYLLPSPTKFVSNGEYTYPVLLIVLPMVMRGLWLILREIKMFKFWEMMEVLSICMMGGGSAFLVGVLFDGMMTTLEMKTGIFVGSYFGALILLRLIIQRRQTRTASVDDVVNEDDEWRKNLQCLSCAIAIYAHVPLILTNVSLALPSALLFSLAFSVGSSSSSSSSQWWIAPVRRIGGMMGLFVTWPPMGLVPKVFGEYTTYVLLLYTPLHLLLMMLWVL